MISADLMEAGSRYQPGMIAGQDFTLPEGLEGLVDQVQHAKARQGTGDVTIWADRPIEVDEETGEIRVSPGTTVFVPKDQNQLFATIPGAWEFDAGSAIPEPPPPRFAPPEEPGAPPFRAPETTTAPISESSVLPFAVFEILRRLGGSRAARWGFRTAVAAAIIAQASCTPMTPPPPTEANVFDQAPAGEMLRADLQEQGIVDQSCILPIAQIEQVRQSGGVASVQGFAAQAEEALQKPHNEHFTELSCDFNEQTNEVIFYFTDDAGDHFVPTSSGEFLQVGVETDGSLTVLGDPDVNVPKELPRVDARLVGASSTKELRESRQAVQDLLKGESFGVSTQVTLATQSISVGDRTYRMWEIYGSKDANVRGAAVRAPVLVHVLEGPGDGSVRVVAYYNGADGEGLYLVKSITVKDDGSVEYIIDTSNAAVSARVKECGSGTCWATITVDQEVVTLEEELKSAAALLSPPVATTRAASALKKWGEGIWIGDFQQDAQLAQGLPEDTQGKIASAGTIRLRTNTEADPRLGESSGDTSLIIVSDPRFVTVTDTGTVVQVDSWLGLVVKPTSTGSSSGSSQESPRVVPFEPRLGKDNKSIEWVVPATGKRIFIQNGNKLTMVVGPNENEVGAQFVPIATEAMHMPTVTEKEFTAESIVDILRGLSSPELTNTVEIDTNAGKLSLELLMSKNGPFEKYQLPESLREDMLYYIFARLGLRLKEAGDKTDFPEYGNRTSKSYLREDVLPSELIDTAKSRLDEGRPYPLGIFLQIRGLNQYFTFEDFGELDPTAPVNKLALSFVSKAEFNQLKQMLAGVPHRLIQHTPGIYNSVEGPISVESDNIESIVVYLNGTAMIIHHNDVDEVKYTYFKDLFETANTDSSKKASVALSWGFSVIFDSFDGTGTAIFGWDQLLPLFSGADIHSNQAYFTPQ